MAQANGAGLYVILDLHWSAPGSTCPMLKTQMADADHDGRVGHGEFVDGGSRMFGMIDANHDGVIDPDELQRASQRLQALAGK